MKRRKMALCTGINDYPGAGADLSGCVNDAMDFARLLRERGYETMELFDAAVTRSNLIVELRRMLTEARFGDTVIFTFSGHGTWVPDLEGDEPDGRDEALVCHDYTSGGLLMDDELFAISQLRRRGVRFLIVSDSCHSGSVMRFAGSGAAGTPRFMPPSMFLQGAALDRARSVESAPPKGRPRTGAILISGCRDEEYSYDASFGGRPNGACTRAALDALMEEPHPTVARWYAGIRRRLPSALYPQTPQLVAAPHQRLQRLP